MLKRAKSIFKKSSRKSYVLALFIAVLLVVLYSGINMSSADRDPDAPGFDGRTSLEWAHEHSSLIFLGRILSEKHPYDVEVLEVFKDSKNRLEGKKHVLIEHVLSMGEYYLGAHKDEVLIIFAGYDEKNKAIRVSERSRTQYPPQYFVKHIQNAKGRWEGWSDTEKYTVFVGTVDKIIKSEDRKDTAILFKDVSLVSGSLEGESTDHLNVSFQYDARCADLYKEKNRYVVFVKKQYKTLDTRENGKEKRVFQKFNSTYCALYQPYDFDILEKLRNWKVK
ncbi:MAG: hypothetical protein AB7E85_00225 [Pseudobdellovibrionaceae bacterium]